MDGDARVLRARPRAGRRAAARPPAGDATCSTARAPATRRSRAASTRAAFVPAKPPSDVEDGWTRRRRGSARPRGAAPVIADDGTVTGEVAVGARRARRRRARGGRRRRPRRRGARRRDARGRGRRGLRRARASLGHVRFDGAPGTRARRAPTAAAAWYIAQALLAAESLGAVELALEMSVAYAKERFTFGRAIGSYQAVKHELVEILRRLENAPLAHVLHGLGGPGQARRVPARRVRLPRSWRARRSTTRRARRSPSTAASARRGSTTRRCTSAARSSRGGCWRARPTPPTGWPASC